MLHKAEIVSALAEAYKAIQVISVISIGDCRRKVLINDCLEHAMRLIDREKENAEENNDISTGETGPSVSE